MKARLLTRDVPLRGFVVALLLLVALHLTVLAGTARERRVLPEAGEALRWAVVSGASLLNCFEGVQDDLAGDVTRDGRPSTASIERAADTLNGCGLQEFEEHVAALALPPAPPILDSGRRRIREAVEEATGHLERAVLDARATDTAMAEDLAAGAPGLPEVATGYRAVHASYRDAQELLTEVEVRLRRLAD